MAFKKKHPIKSRVGRKSVAVRSRKGNFAARRARQKITDVRKLPAKRSVQVKPPVRTKSKRQPHAPSPLRILLASSEVHPYSKTGGLGDMTGAMGKALARAGHQVGIVTPLYGGILANNPDIRRQDWAFDLPMGAARVQGGLYAIQPAKGLTVYFVEQPAYFDRPGIYMENGADYPDNAERFIFFSKCVAHLARYLPLKPEIVHINDWQTGLVPLLIRYQATAEGWGNAPRVCTTIHNLAYQGVFPREAYNLANLPLDYFHAEGAEHYGMLNCLKAGIAFADVITTVSPRYAREITTEQFGEGLDGFLRKRQSRLFGILNGVDYDEWKTQNNPFLKHSFSPRALAGKAKEKSELQKELGLPVQPEVPLFSTVTRLANQKGLDIELGALEEMLRADIQFCLLGSGSPDYEREFQRLARRYPKRAAVRLGFDQGLSQRIEAGSDFYIMPSRFEPCGLNQMYSLRYGTIPIVRRTGGLDDSVVDATEDPRKANGIKFSDYSARALAKAIRKALILYDDPALVRAYRVRGMTADFSWDKTVETYEMVYQAVLNRKRTLLD